MSTIDYGNTCNFAIDDEGIVRRSKAGKLVVSWAKLVAIHVHPEGFIFEKDNGAMPVPLRVLTDEQLQVLQGHVARHRPLRDESGHVPDLACHQEQ